MRGSRALLLGLVALACYANVFVEVSANALLDDGYHYKTASSSSSSNSYNNANENEAEIEGSVKGHSFKSSQKNQFSESGARHNHHSSFSQGSYTGYLPPSNAVANPGVNGNFNSGSNSNGGLGSAGSIAGGQGGSQYWWMQSSSPFAQNSGCNQASCSGNQANGVSETTASSSGSFAGSSAGSSTVIGAGNPFLTGVVSNQGGANAAANAASNAEANAGANEQVGLNTHSNFGLQFSFGGHGGLGGHGHGNTGQGAFGSGIVTGSHTQGSGQGSYGGHFANAGQAGATGSAGSIANTGAQGINQGGFGGYFGSHGSVLGGAQGGHGQIGYPQTGAGANAGSTAGASAGSTAGTSALGGAQGGSQGTLGGHGGHGSHLGSHLGGHGGTHGGSHTHGGAHGQGGTLGGGHGQLGVGSLGGSHGQGGVQHFGVGSQQQGGVQTGGHGSLGGHGGLGGHFSGHGSHLSGHGSHFSGHGSHLSGHGSHLSGHGGHLSNHLGSHGGIHGGSHVLGGTHGQEGVHGGNHGQLSIGSQVAGQGQESAQGGSHAGHHGSLGGQNGLGGHGSLHGGHGSLHGGHEGSASSGAGTSAGSGAGASAGSNNFRGYPVLPKPQPPFQTGFVNCQGVQKICVAKAECVNGYASLPGVSQVNQQNQRCNVATEVCCTVKQKPTGNSGIFGPGESGGDLNAGDNSNNGYLPPYGSSGSHNRPYYAELPKENKKEEDSKDIEPQGSGAELQGTGIRPNAFPPASTYQRGCAAALKCVEEQYCTMLGMISDTPVSLSENQKLRRVPMVDCIEPDTGILGKCCRDPNYVDPWPAGNLPANYSGGFDEQGFPTFLNLSKTKPKKPIKKEPNHLGKSVVSQPPLSFVSFGQSITPQAQLPKVIPGQPQVQPQPQPTQPIPSQPIPSQPIQPQLNQPIPSQPIQPQLKQPIQPQFNQPIPSQPSQPQFNRPIPSQPSQPQFNRPILPQPSQPQFNQPIPSQPSQPQFNRPIQSQPSQPQFNRPTPSQPSQPQFNRPIPSQPNQLQFNRPIPFQPTQPQFNRPTLSQPNQPQLNEPTPSHPTQPQFNRPIPSQPNQPQLNELTPSQPTQPQFNQPIPSRPIQPLPNFGNFPPKTEVRPLPLEHVESSPQLPFVDFPILVSQKPVPESQFHQQPTQPDQSIDSQVLLGEPIQPRPVQPSFQVKEKEPEPYPDSTPPFGAFLQPRPFQPAQLQQTTGPLKVSGPAAGQGEKTIGSLVNQIGNLNPFKPQVDDTIVINAPPDVPDVPLLTTTTTKRPGLFQNFPSLSIFGKGHEGASSSQNAISIPLHTPGVQCGIINDVPNPLKVSDVDVGFGAIPWQAMILSNSEKKLICSGALVAPNVVLTAAHCVYGKNPSDVSIKSGEWKLGYDLKHEEPLPFEIVQVQSIVAHPNYEHGAAGFDTALLYLEKPVKLDLHVDTICVPKTVTPSQRKCVSVGWGKIILQTHAAGALMHKIDVDVLNNQQCAERIQGAESPVDLHDSLVCAKAHKQNNNMCQVDVGGPLACDRGDGIYEVIGVYSQDTGCLPTNQVATFALVDSKWVNGMINSGAPQQQEQQQQQQQPSVSVNSGTVTKQSGSLHHYHQPGVPCDCQQGTQPSGANQYLPPL